MIQTLKKFLLAAVLLYGGITQAQIAIEHRPTFAGNPSPGWVPVVINGTTRKVDPQYFGYSKIDSISTDADTLWAYKNGVKSFYKLLTTAGSGLTRTGNIIRLGGTLTQPASISSGSYAFALSGSSGGANTTFSIHPGFQYNYIEQSKPGDAGTLFTLSNYSIESKATHLGTNRFAKLEVQYNGGLSAYPVIKHWAEGGHNFTGGISFNSSQDTILGITPTGYLIKTLKGSGGTGTVTSVTTGYGLIGGTIITSGTIEADSFFIATRPRVQKAIDSVFGVDGLTYLGSNKISASGAYDTKGLVDMMIAQSEWVEEQKLSNISNELSSIKRTAPSGTVWYVRPGTGHSGTRNGTSYATAWGTWDEIVWGAGGVQAGHTLYVCGAHSYSVSKYVGNHGATTGSRVTIRGDYAADTGSIAFTGNTFLDTDGRNYTTISKLTIYGGTSACIYNGNAIGTTVDACKFIGGTQAIFLEPTINITEFTAKYNECSGQTLRAISCLFTTGSRTHSNWKFIKNYIHDGTGSGIRLTVDVANIGTVGLNDIEITDNVIVNMSDISIQYRIGPTDITTQPSLYGTNIKVNRNLVYACGTVYGASGKGGTITISAAGTGSECLQNIVSKSYALGAGIQLSKNNGIVVRGNVSHDIMSGTPTINFRSGNPIDANGIFIDTQCQNVVVEGNLAYNLSGTADPYSGVAFSFWDSDNSVFRGNFCKNVKTGLSYGEVGETGNVHESNWVIKAETGLYKVGNNAVTHTAKKNFLIECTATTGGGTGGTLITQ